MAEDKRFPTYEQLEEGWKQMQAERDRLRAALLMMKHAYETDNRPNMFIVNEALRPGPQGQDRREVGGCKPEMLQRKSLESSPGRLDHLIDGIIRDVCELPGYNSPEDQPELLQATCSELERILRNRLGVETSTLLPNAARSHKPGPRCDGNNCKGHPFNCYGHPYDCGCSAEETNAVRDSIAPNKQCPKCQRFFWLDKFNGHDCRPEKAFDVPARDEGETPDAYRRRLSLLDVHVPSPEKAAAPHTCTNGVHEFDENAGFCKHCGERQAPL